VSTFQNIDLELIPMTAGQLNQAQDVIFNDSLKCVFAGSHT